LKTSVLCLAVLFQLLFAQVTVVIGTPDFAAADLFCGG
jgi:hypothetical protein